MRNQTSRIAIAVAMAAGLAASLASPSFADVNVTVSVDKTKTIFIDEDVIIDKDVDIDVTAVLTGNGAAEASSLANVDSLFNNTFLDNVAYTTELGGSLLGNIGITQANQAAGNGQNQGNLVSAAVTQAGDAFADSQAEVDQANQNDNIDIQSSEMSASIDGSINGNTGVTQFNQDSGNNNNQTNAVSIAAGVDSEDEDVIVALSESALGQENRFNRVNEGTGSNDPTSTEGPADPLSATQKTASIAGSINTNVGGIIGVNQAAGNNANQANLVSVSAFVNFGGAQ